MSTLLKWVIAIIVLVGAGWLLWWSGWFRNTDGAIQASLVATSTQSGAKASSTSTVPQNGMSALSDSSDAAVAQDAVAVDAQMQALGKDSSQISASLNDTPVAQSY